MHKHEEIAKMITKAELNLENNQPAARRKVILLSLMGYGYFLFLLIVGLGGIAASCAMLFIKGNYFIVKILLAFILFTWFLIRGLYAPPPKPDGIPLKRKDAPEFFEKVMKLSKQLKSIKIHKIFITSQANACVSSQRMFGFIGPSRNIMEIGLPFILSLREEELMSVIGHELGHLSGMHPKFKRWTYRNINLWLDIYHRGQTKGSLMTKVLVNSFVDKFVPRLFSYSIAFSRSMEYDADRFSAEIFEKKITAQALTKVYVLAQYQEAQFWEPLRQSCSQIASIYDVAPYQMMEEFGKQSVDTQLAQTILANIIKRSTLPFDSHPSLRERLAALNEHADLTSNSSNNMALTLLGDFVQKCIQHFDYEWQQHFAGYWHNQHQELLERKLKLEKYDLKGFDTLSEEDQIDYISAMIKLHGDDSVIELTEKVLAHHPKSPSALVLKARHLNKTQPEIAMQYYESLIEDMHFAPEACAALYEYYHNDGQRDRAYEYLKMRTEKKELQKNIELDRIIYLNDNFISHDLSRELLSPIISAVQSSAKVIKAYLVKKVLKHRPEEPLYVLLIKSKNELSASDRELILHKLVIPANSRLQMIEWDKLQRKLRNRITSPSASLIFG